MPASAWRRPWRSATAGARPCGAARLRPTPLTPAEGRGTWLASRKGACPFPSPFSRRLFHETQGPERRHRRCAVCAVERCRGAKLFVLVFPGGIGQFVLVLAGGVGQQRVGLLRHLQ